jgi:hypothetical protein
LLSRLKGKEGLKVNGKYLASNIEPLKVLGEGKVFNAINDLLNSNRFKDVSLTAYSICESESRIPTIECLFKTEGKYGPTLYFRRFDFYKHNGNVEDDLALTAKHGVGFADFDLQNFIKLRDFYLEHSKTPEVEIS